MRCKEIEIPFIYYYYYMKIEWRNGIHSPKNKLKFFWNNGVFCTRITFYLYTNVIIFIYTIWSIDYL